MHSQKTHCAASVPISTFMCLWSIYIIPRSAHIFSCSRIGRQVGIHQSLTAVEAVRVSVEAVRMSIEALRCFRGRERLEEVPENVNWGHESVLSPRRLLRSSQPRQIFQPQQEGFYSVQGLSSPVAALRKDFSAVLTVQSLRHFPGY